MALKIMKFIYLNKLKFKIMKKTERRKTFFVLYKTKKNEFVMLEIFIHIRFE